MELPSDPFMTLSIINMKLRDQFPSLEELCLSLDIDRSSLEARLAEAGFTYDETVNKFW